MSVPLPLLLAAGPAALVPPPQEILADRRRTPVVEVVERVKPAVVSITTTRPAVTIFGSVIEQPGPSGTGVVIFEDGFIITNHHVVADETKVQVRFDESDDTRVYEAVVVSRKPEEDLALLKIEGDEPFHTVVLCESDPILGEPVIAIGNALGHSHTVSTGIVSGLHRDIATREGLRFDNLIQTDASINPGNSGGPLLNINGELIGINSAMQGMAENIGFAIPVNHVRKVLSEQLLALSEARAWLGFELEEDDMRVRAVVAGGPADQAGLAVGDRLVGLAGHLLSNPGGDAHEAYRRVRLSIQPGAIVPLSVQRGREERSLALTAWNKADGILFERLGLGLETVWIGPREGNPYLRITAVQPESPGGRLGLALGDVLTAVQRKGGRATWFQRPDDLAAAISRLRAGSALEIEIWRDSDGDGIYFETDVRRDYSERFQGSLSVR